MIKFNVLLFV